MLETISALVMRKKLGEVLNRVALRQEKFIIERQGKELAAVVPVELLRQIEKAAELQLLKLLNIQDKPKINDTKAMSLANEAKHNSRKNKTRK